MLCAMCRFHFQNAQRYSLIYFNEIATDSRSGNISNFYIDKSFLLKIKIQMLQNANIKSIHPMVKTFKIWRRKENNFSFKIWHKPKYWTFILYFIWIHNNKFILQGACAKSSTERMHFNFCNVQFLSCFTLLFVAILLLQMLQKVVNFNGKHCDYTQNPFKIQHRERKWRTWTNRDGEWKGKIKSSFPSKSFIHREVTDAISL